MTVFLNLETIMNPPPPLRASFLLRRTNGERGLQKLRVPRESAGLRWIRGNAPAECKTIKS